MAWRLYVVLRSAVCWVLLAIVTVLITTPYIFIALVHRESVLTRWLERFWTWAIIRGSRVKLSARGLENVVPGQSYVVMANHRSLYDIPALYYLLGRDRDLRFIGKKELVKIPIFGWAFGLSRHVVIDRQRRQRAIAALRNAAAESREGVTFVIMPEGTRNRGEGLLPFKKGPFHLAIDTGLPILPVAIIGSNKLMRKGSWKILPGAIEVRVLPPIPVEGLDKSHVEELSDRTRASIEEALPEHETAGSRP
jgi:1-acyl-sn-glycerol-3-phosphate acyltransferase